MEARRRVLRVVAAFVVACAATPVPAQDPTASTVQATARDWLALADRGDGGATFEAAGAQFKNAMTSERWSAALAAARAPFGTVVQRSMFSTTFRKSVRGAPDGEYALVLFRTSFTHKADARETVTLERESDGRWRVVGYFIQ